ncbi:MAG: universal stress protein [Bacteroidia bacterium]|nr:universal stress protein [Bacteroidia bacterium]
MKTKKMKKVLIALDYNPTAQKVAETGFSLAKAMKAKVILLHVIIDSIYYSSADYSSIMGFTGYSNLKLIQLKTVEGLKEASQQFLDKSKRHLADKTIKTLIKEGDCAETIIKTAEELNVDIIVMGSHSRRWLENILMGSVAEKVLHHTSLPLFIIPTKQNK